MTILRRFVASKSAIRWYIYPRKPNVCIGAVIYSTGSILVSFKYSAYNSARCWSRDLVSISRPGLETVFWRSWFRSWSRTCRSWSQSQSYRSRSFNLRNNSTFTTQRATIPPNVERLNAMNSHLCTVLRAHNCIKKKFTYLNFSGYFVSTLNSVFISLIVTIGLKANTDNANNNGETTRPTVIRLKFATMGCLR
jgi:hypothetical protein